MVFPKDSSRLSSVKVNVLPTIPHSQALTRSWGQQRFLVFKTLCESTWRRQRLETSTSAMESARLPMSFVPSAVSTELAYPSSSRNRLINRCCSVSCRPYPLREFVSQEATQSLSLSSCVNCRRFLLAIATLTRITTSRLAL